MARATVPPQAFNSAVDLPRARLGRRQRSIGPGRAVDQGGSARDVGLGGGSGGPGHGTPPGVQLCGGPAQGGPRPGRRRERRRAAGPPGRRSRACQVRIAPGPAPPMPLPCRRYRQLGNEIKDLEDEIQRLTRTAAPALVDGFGIGPDTAATLLIAAGSNPDRLHSEAAFASLCGVNPIPASSGKTNRHRLNRGGHRQANAALHRIVAVRLRHDERTQAYMRRRTTDGMSKAEVIRCLKRYVAREVFSVLRNSALSHSTP